MSSEVEAPDLDALEVGNVGRRPVDHVNGADDVAARQKSGARRPADVSRRTQHRDSDRHVE